MSNDDGNDTHRPCRLCSEMVPEGALADHLDEAHGDEPEAVEREYGGGTFEGVMDDLDARGWPRGADADDGGETTGGKWYVLGVGGCGNNLLDAIRLRRDRPGRTDAGRSRGRSPEVIWGAALQGSEMVNTDSKDLSNTYSARELGDRPPGEFAETRTISPGQSSEGAGKNPQKALEWIRNDFTDADGEIPFRVLYSDEFNRADVQNAQAVLLLHSTIRGTGTGATPYLAERLAADAVDDRKEKPIFAATVLPEEGDYSEHASGQTIRNGLIGPARTATAADAIVPFDNEKLRPPVGTHRIEWPAPEDCNASGYGPQNEAFVEFMELFSMSSLPATANSELGIHGDNFDVTDAFEPARRMREDRSSIDEELATVLAPAMRRYHRRLRPGEFDEETLRNLLLDTCLSGRLAEFDPATAWGGTFLFVVPREIKDEVEAVVKGNDEPFTAPGVLDAQDGDAPVVEPERHVIGADAVDTLYLWATFWNPVLETYGEMADIAHERLRGMDVLEAEREKIDQFLRLQGRETLPASRGRQL